MERDKNEKSLYIKLLQITLIPILLLTIVITSFSVNRFATVLHGEVRQGLMDLSSAIMTLYDQLYPGDYSVTTQNNALYMLKGDHQINGDFSIIDTIKVRMRQLGALNSLMSGSGPTVFGIFIDEKEARQACEIITEEKLAKQVYVTEFC